MAAIKKQDYQKPTPTQCVALPIVLSRRDIIGIAKTGSGKTATLVLPMIVHIMDQPELQKEEGPIGVICAPTRELAHQIYLRFKELKAGCEIVFATPGRLIDMLKMKALTMLRATYLVLDEADQMFDLGFEPQIRSIVGQIRPDRQTLLFSATMLRKVEKLAREILSDPIRVTVGEVGMANEDITQVVHVIPSDDEKLPWLFEKLPGMIDEGDVLVFASKKAAVDEIESQLAQKGRAGDKDGTAYTLITQKEARFAGELVNSLVAAGQIVSTELMDLAMKKGRGRGGGGRGVRGVDFGLGIGYNTESNSSSSNTVPSRSVAVTPQRTGMMSQFKTKFVAASSNSPSQGSANSSSVPNRQALRGFVSGGSIGGDVYRTQATSTITPAPAPTSMVNKTATPNTGQNSSQKPSESSRDKPRERRRRSVWDC
ncbi:hypothetical protein FF2_025483 [Malus domestica]